VPKFEEFMENIWRKKIVNLHPLFSKREYNEIMMLNFKGAVNIIFALENFLAVKIFAKY
jgi:hypothetical protein